MLGLVIEEVIKQFSLRILYIQMVWFMTFGYIMHIFTVMALTRLPFAALVKSIARLQFAAIVGSCFIAPVCAALSILVAQFCNVDYKLWFLGQQLYLWFTICMMLLSSDLLCKVFVTVACSRFKLWLIVVNAFVGIIGFFVLKSMNLLVGLT